MHKIETLSHLFDMWSSDLERGMKTVCLFLGTALWTDLDIQTLCNSRHMLCISAILALLPNSCSLSIPFYLSLSLSPLYSNVKKETKTQLMCFLCACVCVCFLFLSGWVALAGFIFSCFYLISYCNVANVMCTVSCVVNVQLLNQT